MTCQDGDPGHSKLFGCRVLCLAGRKTPFEGSSASRVEMLLDSGGSRITSSNLKMSWQQSCGLEEKSSMGRLRLIATLQVPLLPYVQYFTHTGTLAIPRLCPPRASTVIPCDRRFRFEDYAEPQSPHMRVAITTIILLRQARDHNLFC